MKETLRKVQEFSRYLFCLILVLVVFCVFGLRLIDWQIINGEEWLKVSSKINTSSVKMPAARGEILDVNGVPLAVNKTGYSIVFDRVYMTADTQNTTILRLAALLEERKEEWINELPIQLTSAGEYAFIQGREKEAGELIKLLRLNSYATAAQCVRQMVEDYDCAGYSPQDTLTVLSVRYNMVKSGFSVSTPYTFAQDVSADTVAIVSENSQNLPGATIQVTTMREHPNGTVAPHIVGSIGSITQEEYDAFKAEGNTYSLENMSGYAYNDTLGKSGIESAFEERLRGKSGTRVIETTRTGALANSTVTIPPQHGDTIYLTIDSELQKVAQVSLANNVAAAREYGEAQKERRGESGYGEDCVAGGVVVLRVKDFAVLAGATCPSYDLGLYMTDSDYYLSLVNDPTKPLYNRAFVGSFMPGSAFKPLVACAALEEGIIGSSSTVTCLHRYTYWNDYQPSCMGYHGSIALNTALQKSCNVFFFDVGRRLGIDHIDLYAQRFGLGDRTGIEITEGRGILASPEVRTDAGGLWNPGDVIQAAIGQSDNSFTPLQLATYTATIANNGVRYRTHLVDRITTYDRDEVLLYNDPDSPEIVADTDISPENIKLVQQGMRAVCQSGGTAGATFSRYGIAVAGKTGTAENPPHSDNTVFVAYAPYENPEIAVAVVLEYGSTGSFSTAVAKDIFDAYFYGKYVNENGELTMPGSEVPTGAGNTTAPPAASSSASSAAPPSASSAAPSSAPSAESSAVRGMVP